MTAEQLIEILKLCKPGADVLIETVDGDTFEVDREFTGSSSDETAVYIKAFDPDPEERDREERDAAERRGFESAKSAGRAALLKLATEVKTEPALLAVCRAADIIEDLQPAGEPSACGYPVGQGHCELPAGHGGSCR